MYRWMNGIWTALWTTYSLVFVSHLILASYNSSSGTSALLPHAGLELISGEWVIALGMVTECSIQIISRSRIQIISHKTELLTRALILSWCFCSNVAQSTWLSLPGSRDISSGCIFSNRALTSHSCRCLALRYGFESSPSKLGSPAPKHRRILIVGYCRWRQHSCLISLAQTKKRGSIFYRLVQATSSHVKCLNYFFKQQSDIWNT